MVYHAALEATAAARKHFAAGDIAARTRSLNHAAELVTELVTSLECPPDPEGAKLENNLRKLYDYVLHQLAQAAIEQSPLPLDPADQVLRELLEGWHAIEKNPVQQPESHAAISVSA